MKCRTKLTTIAALTLSPVSAMAGKGKGKNKNAVEIHRVTPNARIVTHCPPGLAKKAVPCVPPGRVKNRYKVGDRIDRDYFWINNPYRYGLKRGDSYVRAGDYVYRIDPETRKVPNLIGAVADFLN